MTLKFMITYVNLRAFIKSLYEGFDENDLHLVSVPDSTFLLILFGFVGSTEVCKLKIKKRSLEEVATTL